MRPSDSEAMVPVTPLATMFAMTCPGARSPNTACIMFDIALIGPQFVSPKTRRPTSMSGSDSRMAASVIQTGIPSVYCTHTTSAEQGERERLVEGEAKRGFCRAISFQPAVAARRLGRDEHRDVLLECREVDEPTFVSRAAVLVERNAVADALGGFRRRALDHLPQPFEPRAHRGRCGGDVGGDALGFFHVNSLL